MTMSEKTKPKFSKNKAVTIMVIGFAGLMILFAVIGIVK